MERLVLKKKNMHFTVDARFRLPNGNIFTSRSNHPIEIYDKDGNFDGLVFLRQDLGLPEICPEYFMVKATLKEFESGTYTQFDLFSCKITTADQKVFDLLPYDQCPFN